MCVVSCTTSLYVPVFVVDKKRVQNKCRVFSLTQKKLRLEDPGRRVNNESYHRP